VVAVDALGTTEGRSCFPAHRERRPGGAGVLMAEVALALVGRVQRMKTVLGRPATSA
jgi:hypothetical protein